jgi:hypothetical protein
MEEPLKYFFISQGTIIYENIYRLEKVDSGEHNLVTAKLLPRKCVFVNSCYIYTYTHTHTRTYHKLSRNP